MNYIKLKSGRSRRGAHGHPWVYSNEVEMTADAKTLANGSLVTLTDSGGKAQAVAMFNPRSLIAARILSPDPKATIDEGFLAGRLTRALELRERFYDTPFYRLVNSEGDGLPGLIIDRLGDIYVLQINAAGMELLLPEILAALDQVVSPTAVLLRNDGPLRNIEGLEPEIRWARGSHDGPVELIENSVRFMADPGTGQKTGWFFDHRPNRALVAGLARGARVLDLYCYLGGFGIQALAAGAAEAVLVDRSETALALAGQSAELNGLAGDCRLSRANAFDEAERLAKAGERFDIVITDPPAFVKTKKDLGAGARGYRKLVRLASTLVAPGGLMFAATCSFHMSVDNFAEQIRGGLGAAERTVRIIATGGAGPDHPVHPFLADTAYLKYQLLQLD